MQVEDLIPDLFRQKDEIHALINSIDDDYKKMDISSFPDEANIYEYIEWNYPNTYKKLQALAQYFSMECTFSIDNLTCAETYIRRIDEAGMTNGRGKLVGTLAGIRMHIILADE